MLFYMMQNLKPKIISIAASSRKMLACLGLLKDVNNEKKSSRDVRQNLFTRIIVSISNSKPTLEIVLLIRNNVLVGQLGKTGNN